MEKLMTGDQFVEIDKKNGPNQIDLLSTSLRCVMNENLNRNTL